VSLMIPKFVQSVPHGETSFGIGTLGPVDIHRSQTMAPTRNSMDANESAVFS
jgi:hypothetical protein